MDLSFPRPIPAGDAPPPTADAALLAALMSVRTAASATAEAQAALDPLAAKDVDEPPLAPASGAFSSAMALRLVDWRDQ